MFDPWVSFCDRSRANLFLSGSRRSFGTSIFNISGQFIEVFFTIYSIMVLVGEVWFYFFISYLATMERFVCIFNSKPISELINRSRQ